jgi:quercetin dioxygenase-like cupin family protein
VKVRRVVTGFDPSGQSVVSADDVVEDDITGPAGIKIGLVWAYDDRLDFEAPNALVGRDPATLRSDDLRMKWGTYELPAGGAMHMHATKTVDLVTVLEGEVTLVLEGGTVTVLRAHDVLLQRGVVHAWENRSASPARWTAVTLGRLDLSAR